jgi:predicted RNase H-like nuclease
VIAPKSKEKPALTMRNYAKAAAVLAVAFLSLISLQSSCFAIDSNVAAVDQEFCEAYSVPKKETKFNPRGLVTEESGIATSIQNPGVLLVHNDNFSKKVRDPTACSLQHSKRSLPTNKLTHILVPSF